MQCRRVRAGKVFGDEFVLKADARLVDFTGRAPAMQFVFGHLGSGKPGLERIRLAMAFLAGGHRDGEVMLENHWRAADDLMAGLELPQPVRDSVQQTYARWDGNGVPPGLGGEDILITSRLVNLAPRSSSRIAARRACETRRPLRTGARSTKMTGIAELAVTRSVTASARRVLPKPPTPSNVTRRELATSRSTQRSPARGR
jgi:HD domain